MITMPDGMKRSPSVPSPSSSTSTLKLRPPVHLNFTVFKFVGFLQAAPLLFGFSQVHFPLPFREEAGLACTPKAQKTHFTPVSLFIGLFLAPVGHFALLFAAL